MREASSNLDISELPTVRVTILNVSIVDDKPGNLFAPSNGIAHDNALRQLVCRMKMTEQGPEET